ncbi:helix-turn-helix domain-containing protein, partial [Bacillus pumilus]
MTELGKRLVEAREEKGMSLEDLQTVTKIQKRYLLAIEQGNYDIIPGKFYVRAFIKQYAEAVG